MEKTLEMDFLMNFPAVILQDGKYVGYIFVNDTAYPISIIPFEDGTKYKLENNPKIEKFHSELPPYSNKHPVLILNALKSAIAKKNLNVLQTCNNPTEIWRQILREYTEFNNYHVTIESLKLSSDLREIKVVHVDGGRRLHEVLIKANYDKGSKLFEIVGYDLPESCSFQADDSLMVIYDKFVGAVEGLQGFFDLMDEIDQNCWVLDPEKPARKDCYRRIALDDKLSIVVTFSPLNMQQMPNIKFLGPLNLVTPLTEKYNSNFINWDIGGNVINEVLKLLELEGFPCKPYKDSEEDLVLVNTGECCVCFSLRLEDKLPEIVCPNSSCSQFFHTECLYQWLISLNSKTFFNTTNGQCPNCDKMWLSCWYCAAGVALSAIGEIPAVPSHGKDILGYFALKPNSRFNRAL